MNAANRILDAITNTRNACCQPGELRAFNDFLLGALVGELADQLGGDRAAALVERAAAVAIDVTEDLRRPARS
jgi:hypothetical protein